MLYKRNLKGIGDSLASVEKFEEKMNGWISN